MRPPIPRWTLLRDAALASWNYWTMPGRSYRGPLPPADAELRASAAELEQHVRQLAEEIGERNVSHAPRSLAAASDYIEQACREAGFVLRDQEYRVSGVVCRNLEIEIPGTRRPDEIVIVGAHYDSVPGSPAANDNGSGVAAVLELARHFARMEPGERTLRLVAFVNEEAPYAHTDQMGSWVYARQCRANDEKVVAMLSLETIGCYFDAPGTQRYPAPLRWLYPSTGNFIAFVGNTRYSRLVRQVARAFREHEPLASQAGALPEAMSDIGRSDHWPFWREGFPALMVTDTAPFRYAYYHTPHDTADKLDYDRIARVVRGMKHVVGKLLNPGP